MYLYQHNTIIRPYKHFSGADKQNVTKKGEKKEKEKSNEKQKNKITKIFGLQPNFISGYKSMGFAKRTVIYMLYSIASKMFLHSKKRERKKRGKKQILRGKRAKPNTRHQLH